MTFTIPAWALWTLGIVGAGLFVAGIAIVVVFAWVGYAMARAYGRGLNW